MRRIPTVLLTGLTLFSLSCLATAQQGGGRFGRGDGEAPKLKNFTFEEGTLKSAKVRNGEAGYGIYLPKGYADEANKDTKYPVVIWLHGFGGAGEWSGGGGAEVLDQLRGEGKVPPLAMVVFRAPGRRTTIRLSP